MKTKFRIFIFFFTISLLFIASYNLFNQADWDLWHRFAVGRYFFENGDLAYRDIYSYMPVKQRWVDHEWASGLVFYKIHQMFSDQGLFVLKTVACVAIIALIILTVRIIRPDTDPYRILLYGVTAIGFFPGFIYTVRCQTFTYFFYALWIYVLERFKNNHSLLLYPFFAVTMVIWCNLHGGFPAGIGLVFIFAFRELFRKKKDRKYFLILPLICLVTLINPYGYWYLVFILHAVKMPRPTIREWKSVDLFGDPGAWLGFKVILLIFLVTVAYILIKRIRLKNIAGLTMTFVTLFLALGSQRHCIFFIITASVYVYPFFFDMLDQIKPGTEAFMTNCLGRKNFNMLRFSAVAFVYMFLITLFCNALIKNPYRMKIPQKRFPVEAVRYMQENHLKGNILTSFNMGAYTLWKLYPDCKVSMDSRYETAYPSSTYKEVRGFYAVAENWKEFLDKYPHDYVFTRNGSAIDDELTRYHRVKKLFKGKIYSIYSL